MFYVFHGEDTFAQKERLAELLAKVGDPSLVELNTTRFEGVMAFGDFRQSCDVVPFLARNRVTIVQNLLAARPNEVFLGKLLAYLPSLPETARVFFLESSAIPANHRLIKLAEKATNGFVRRFDRPDGAALSRWIQQRVQSRGGTISPRAVHMLAENIGNDLAVQENEIAKLVMFRGDAQAISAEDVALLCPYVAEASIFDMVDAIGNRDARQAALLLQQKLNEGTDPFYLFAMLIRQFRLLIQVKEAAENGVSTPEIGKTLRLHPYVATKIHQQGHGFSLQQLEKVYAHLLDIDVGVKTGQAEMTTSLHLFVAALTA